MIFNCLSAYLCKVNKIIATFAKNSNEMKVEREIAGFALPFTAGVILTSLIGITSHDIHVFNASASLAALSVPLAAVLHPGTRRRARASWVLTVFMALCLGCFCGACGKILEISNIENRVSIWAEKLGMLMQERADAVPFRNPDTNALIKALLTGERCDIPSGITTAFRDSGASHILALSGFHLGIIYGLVTSLLSLAGNRRKALATRSVVTIFICLVYTLATGAGASIVRALLFIIINETARMTHRYRSTGSVLLTALVIQLTISPSSISSVGFQLSYAAMAGIAFIFPWMKSLWPGRPHEDRGFAKWMRRTWDSASMSISCQLTTAPLAWYYFHSFPVHFLLTNLIALPLTGIIIPSALGVMVLDSIGLCPGFMIHAVEFLVTMMTEALDIIAEM